MKRNSTLLLILALFLTCNFASAKTPQLRGLSETIASLDSSYCNTETNAQIVPDALDPRTKYVTWKVSYSLGLVVDQPSLYTVSGIGRDAVLHFNPSAVPSSKYGQKIYFIYSESDDDALYNSKSDNTRVFPVPTAYNFSNDTTICPGGTATLRLLDSESDMRYILFKNGARTATIQNGTGSLISFPVTTVGTYSLKAQNVNDTTCMVDMNNSVTVAMFPIVTPTLTGLTDVCIGLNKVTYTTDASKSNYIWKVSEAGGIITEGFGTNQIKVIWHTSGPHQIDVNYTNANSCTALTPTKKTVNVHPLPIPIIDGDSVPCINSNENYTTEGGMSNYSWSVTGGTIIAGSNTNTITVNWTSLGNHIVTVNYNDTYGCTAISSTQYKVRVADRPAPTINGATSVCQGTTGVIYQTEIGKSNYSWSIPAGGTITAGGNSNQITVTWTSAGSRTVEVNYENADGCAAQTKTSYAVEVLPLPVPSITGKDTVCLGQLGTVYTTEAGKSAYVWSILSGGSIVSGVNAYQAVVNWDTPGNPQTIRVTYQDTNGCFAAAPTNHNVIVSALPTPTITGADTVCARYPDVTYTTESGKSNYTWTITSGGTITTGLNSYQPTVSWTSMGDNIMTLNYKNNFGCAATTPTSKNIYVKDSPNPSIAGPNSFCLDTAAVKVYSTQGGMLNYNWVLSAGGTIVSGQNTNSISVKWTTSGTKTVSVNYSFANGCSAPTPTDYTVTVKPSPVPTITGLTPVCDGNTYKYYTETGMSNYTWHVNPGDAISNGVNPDTVYVTWNTVGVHTIDVTYSNADGCYALTPTSENITVQASPTPTFTLAPNTACAGDTKTYTTDASQFNYIWNVPTGGTIQNGQGTNSIQVVWDSAGSHTVTVNYENANGCKAASPASTAVTVFATPTPTITGDDTVCINSTINYYTQSSMTGYVWTVTGGTIVSGQGTDNVNVQWDNVGKQSIEVNYNNASGCPATTPTKMDVEVSPLPIPTITGNKNVCTGFATTYSTEAGMNNYIWSISGGGTIVSGNGSEQITVNWTSAGKRAVKITYLNPAGCAPIAQTIDSITVTASPVPTITGKITVCEGTINEIYTTQTGQLDYDWQISAGGVITDGAGSNTIKVTWNTPGPQTLSVNYKNAGGCIASTPTVKNITVVGKPAPTITGLINSCTADTVGYKTESGMNTYIWTVTSGGTLLSGQGSDSITVLWNGTGTETISVTYKNSAGCVPASLKTQDIAVGVPATPSIVGSQALCAGVTTSYTTEKGMFNYIWSVSSGGTLVSGAGTDSITVLWNTAGARTITVNYDNADGCNATIAKVLSVTVYNAPTPIISGSLTVCEGATNVSYTTTAGMSNYVWTVTGGTITSGAGTDKIQVDWTTVGNQTITLNYKNLGGCSAATPSSRMVNVVAKPVPTISGVASICKNDTTTYTTETGMNTYNWIISAGGTIISGQGTNSVQVAWATDGAHTISVSYKNSTGCTAASPTTKNITVNATPVPTITGTKTVCQDATGTTYTTEAGMSNYSWSISGGTITAGLGTNQVTVTWNTPGKNPIRVNYTNASGCTADTATVDSITVNPITIPTISGPTPVCIGASSVVYTTEMGLNNYNWTISSGGSIVSGQGTYQLTVNWNTVGSQTLTSTFKNEFGCQAAAPTSKTINVIAKPVPTVTGSATACLNQNTIYTTESGMSGYLWTLSPGHTIISGSGTNTLVVRWTTSGAKTVSINYTVPGNCTADSPTDFSVTVNTPPTPTLTGPDTVCANGGTYAFTTDAGMSNYTWSNTGSGTLVSGIGTYIANYSWNTVGNKTVYINYKDANGCLAASPTSKAVYAKASPVPTITGTKTLCQGSTGVKYYTEGNQNNYVWAVSAGGSITSGQGTDTIYVNWATAGKQTISVNYNNSIGCAAVTATVDTVTVNALPIPKITASNNGCIGSTTTITTDAGMSNYVWTVSAGATIQSGQGSNQIIVSWSAPGNETVSITYTNPNGCNPVSATDKIFTVSAVPVVSVAVDKNPICESTNVTFTASADLAMSNYKYYINATSINNGSNPAYSTSTLINNDNVYVVGTSTNGCVGTSNTIQMSVYDIPTAGLVVSPNTSIIAGTNTTFTASGTGDYQFYLNGTIVQAYSSNNAYAISTLNNNDIVSLKVKNGNDCYDSTAVTITVLDTIIKKAVIASATDYCVSDNGVSIILNNPQAGITYKLIRTTDNSDLGTGTISGSSIVWSNIKTGATGTREFKVVAYYPAFPSNIIEMSNRLNVTEVPLPGIFFMSPTGTQTNCNSGTGFEVKLSGSETGVKYYLYRDGSTTGTTLNGTGSELSFGNQVVSGTYTIVAENTTATSCKLNMTGSFIINTATQTIYDLSSNPANGHYCAGSAGVVLSLNGSTNGVDYLLYRDATTYVKTVKGNGNAISFGTVTTEGTYTVVVNESGCLTSMNGAITVVKDQLPTAYNLSATNNGTYCEGTLGVKISLENQELGVEYQLLLNGIAEGAPIVGSVAGAAFDFPGNYITEGVYSVRATRTDAGCISTSANTITVDKAMTPLDLAITGDTTFCNGSSAEIKIASTESDVMYRLLKDNIETGDASLGNGGLLTFNVTTNGVYKVLAQRVSGGVTCPFELTDSVVINKTIDPDIKAYTWVDGTGCTQGTVITIIQTQQNIEYTLYNRANNLPLSNSTLIGDGSDLSFPEIVDNDGYYYIVAQNGACGIEFTNPGDVHVAIDGVAQKQEVTIPSTICADVSTVTIGLKTTEVGVSYDLYIEAGDIKVSTTPIIGDGNAQAFASVSAEGTYYVIASSGGCDVEMLNRVNVTFNKLPKQYTLSGNGYYCPSMNGTTLQVDSTELGITYALQLKSGASWNTTNQIVGSGSSISFNNVLTEGDYRVLATSPKGCTTIMTDTITVVSKTTPTTYAVSIDNSNYCNLATGADLYLAGTEKDVTYFIVNLNTNDSTTYAATTDSSTPVQIATLPEGFYNVWAAWLGSACSVSLTPTPVQVSKLSLPIDNFTITVDAVVICNGDSTYLRVPNAQNGVIYDIEKDGAMLNLPLDIANGEVKWRVTSNPNSTTTYRVYAYVTGYQSCGFFSDNSETLETRVKPNSYNLTPSIASLCKGDQSSSVIINVSDAQANLIYELFDANNNLIDTHTPTSNGAFNFTTGVMTGVYNVTAKYNIGNCSAPMNNTTSVTEDDSSLVCFTFEAVTDIMYLPKGSSTSSISVSKQVDGGNDILSALVDLNLEYKLITTWTNATGNTVSTNGTVEFKDNSLDVFTYTKTKNFYGKDSVIYEITNLDHPNRKDTAMIYIFVGNEEIADSVTILIPNAFTPNGDNKNDYFIIEGIDGLITSELQVFNRWGSLVYRSTGDSYDNSFDGTANSGVAIGEELPVGTYFYLYNATFKNTGTVESKKFSGFIELRR